MLIIIGTILFVLFIFGSVLGSFDFTRSERLGKTNYYLLVSVANVVGLYHQYPDEREGFYNVLGGCITDVYWNEQYILATQSAVSNDSVEGYYVVKMLPPIEKGVPWKKYGLLSKEEYEEKKQELNLNEKEMKHTNLYDNKHKIISYVKSFAPIGIFLTIIFYVFRRIFKFLKSKTQE